MAYKPILTRGDEEQIHEFDAIEKAFDAAEPYIMRRYLARMTDNARAVRYTQALVDGLIGTYPGDATAAKPAIGVKVEESGHDGSTRPWWKFW